MMSVLREFDHIPTDEELRGVGKYSVKLGFVPDEAGADRLIKLGCPLSILLTQVPDEAESQVLVDLADLADFTQLTLWLDHLPSDEEVLRIKDLRLGRGTQKDVCMLLFEIPDYIDRRRIRTVSTFCTAYPFLFIERIPTYEERRDIYLTYPALGTIIALEHIPVEDEIVSLSRVKPSPLLGIFLERMPEDEELRRLADIKPETILYVMETPMQDYTDIIGAKNRIEVVSSRGEMVRHLMAEAIR